MRRHLVAGLVIGLIPVVASGQQPLIRRVSTTASGTESNGINQHPSISSSGRFIVFESQATNLKPLDQNSSRDIFMRDRDPDENGIFDEPGTDLVLISVAFDRSPANASSFDSSVAGEGRHAAFVSDATNLVAVDTNSARDVFIRDRDPDADGILDESGPGETATLLVSLSSSGTQGNGSCALPKMSANGRHVVYETLSDNYGITDTNGTRDIYVYDRDPDGNGILDEGLGATTLISANSSGLPANGENSRPTITPDGRFVAFDSPASDLVLGDTNGLNDVFIVDRDPDQNGAFDEGNAVTTRMSVGAGGVEGNGLSRRAWMTSDGRYVTWESEADNLGPVDTNLSRDIYLRDRDPDANGIFDEGNEIILLVSKAQDGTESNNQSLHSVISGDGRIIAYVSFANNLTPNENNGSFDVFAYDRDPDLNGVLDEGNSLTFLLSANSSGVGGNRLSGNGEISSDGQYMTFASDSTNLDGPDSNSVRDIFVRTVFIDALPTETYCTGKTTSQGLVPFITFDGFPSVVNTNALPFRIIGNDLVPGESGIILFSFQKSELDFHGGKLCIKAPVRKLFPVKQVLADGTVLRNMNNVLTSPPDPMMTVGQKVYCQWRISDPTNPSGFGDALTDAVRFTISP